MKGIININDIRKSGSENRLTHSTDNATYRFTRNERPSVT